MNKNILIFFLLLYFINLKSQNSKLSIHFGFEIDHKIKPYEFLIGKFGADAIRNAKESRHLNDYGIFINVMKDWYFLNETIAISTGLGYAEQNRRQKLPASNKYFDIRYYIFITSHNYQAQYVQIPFSTKVNLFKTLQIGPLLTYNIRYLSYVDSENVNPSVANLRTPTLKSGSLETYVSANMKLKKTKLSFDYGIWQGRWKDDALANDGVNFRTESMEKWRFSVGFYINKTKEEPDAKKTLN